MSKRRKIICISCGNEQSTYSSNRDKCHKCKPKCRERHTFHNLNARKAKSETKSKETVKTDE